MNTVFNTVSGPPTQHNDFVPDALSRELPHVGVYVESAQFSNTYAFEPKIRWAQITKGMDGTDTTATFAAELDAADLAGAGSIGNRHLTHLMDQLSSDRLIRIAKSQGASGSVVLFEGYPQTQTANWTANGQAVTVTALCRGQEWLRTSARTQITGRYMRQRPRATWDPTAPDRVLVMAMPPVFNPKGAPNRTNDEYPLTLLTGRSGGEPVTGTHNVNLFADERNPKSPETTYWRYLDALRYVCLTHIADRNDAPLVSVREFLADTERYTGSGSSPGDPDPFLRLMLAPVRSVSIQSLNAEEAIAVLCKAAGLHYEIALVSSTDASAFTSVRYVLRIFASVTNADDLAAMEDRLSVSDKMLSPVLRDMPREAPYTNHSDRTPSAVAEGNKIQQATLSIDRRAINRVAYLGGAHSFEVFVLMRPGWRPHTNLDNLSEASQQERDDAKDFWREQLDKDPDHDPDTGAPLSKYQDSHPDFPSVKDVARLWVFPDSMEYLDPPPPFPPSENGTPLHRDVFPAQWYTPFDPADGVSSVFGSPVYGAGLPFAHGWVPRRRPFEAIVADTPGVRDHEPIVFVHYDHEDPTTALQRGDWTRFVGSVRVDPNRAAIYFACDNLLQDYSLWVTREGGTELDNTMLDRYIDGKFKVAVLATITGDGRLSLLRQGGNENSRRRFAVVDTGFDVYQQHRLVNAAVDRDDELRFSHVATAHAERMAQAIVAGNPEIFYIDTTLRVGDGITGCDGLGIVFETAPHIAAITYSNDPNAGQRTLLTLSDARHNVEIGTEA